MILSAQKRCAKRTGLCDNRVRQNVTIIHLFRQTGRIPA